MGIGPTESFGCTPDELLTLSKPNSYPKSANALVLSAEKVLETKSLKPPR